MPKVGCSVTPRKSLVGRERMLKPPAEKVTPSAQIGRGAETFLFGSGRDGDTEALMAGAPSPIVVRP